MNCLLVLTFLVLQPSDAVTLASLEAGWLERAASIDNGRARFERIITLPGRENIRTYHEMTFAGDQLVRTDDYQFNDQGAREFYHVTLELEDQRQLIPRDTTQAVHIFSPDPEPMATGPLGNSFAGLIFEHLRLEPDSGEASVTRVTRDGSEIAQVRGRLSKPEPWEFEFEVDLTRDHLVTRFRSWVPSRENYEWREDISYDTPVQNEEGIWYPSRVSRSTYRPGADSEQHIKTFSYEIHAFETNVEIDVATTFDATIAEGRRVLDERTAVSRAGS